jgi:hypothetical protein
MIEHDEDDEEATSGYSFCASKNNNRVLSETAGFSNLGD